MKKIITFTLLCAQSVLFVSCSNRSDQSTNAGLDTIQKKETVHIDKDDQVKVIGNINFDIDSKQFKLQKKRFLKSSSPNKYQTEFKIGDYVFSSIDPEYHNNKLYSATITGDLIHYEDYKSELLNQAATLKSMLEKRYGEPSINYGPPEWHRTEKNYSYLAYRWVIGSKTIEERVSNSGLYYTVDLKIYQHDVVDMIEAEESKKKSEVEDKAKSAL